MEPVTEERFWAFVTKTPTCWNWSGSKTEKGYGRFCITRNQREMAHRVSYGLVLGNIPAGGKFEHSCRNNACVNPDHLSFVAPKVDLAEFTRLHRRGLTQKELAERFGIARSNVIAINSELGLRRRKRPPRILDAERATIERLHNAGLTAPEIAEELGRTASDIRRIREQMGLKFARRMTPERKAAIQLMLDDGWSWKEIERTEGANYDTMRRHFPGTAWTHSHNSRMNATTRNIRPRLGNKKAA